MKRDAILSPCGTYRYALSREWGTGPVRLCIGLNPSTADATIDDATVRRLVSFAERDGFGSLLVGNLYGYRATDPKELKGVANPIGPMNDSTLFDLADAADQIVCMWGAGGLKGSRVLDVLGLLGPTLWCFGLTADGHPRHPVRLGNDTPVERYRWPAFEPIRCAEGCGVVATHRVTAVEFGRLSVAHHCGRKAAELTAGASSGSGEYRARAIRLEALK